jgi:CheY-like chemotaxis protein
MNSFDILIIEDEKVVIDSVIKIGQLNDYKIDFVEDAINGLKKLSENKYKLVICDIMLYEMDGFQFLSEMQKIKNDTPIIMTTGFSTIENAVRSLSGGAIDFIPKPFTFDEISCVIKRCLKYFSLINEQEISGDNLIYVPCPTKYYRLGYSSWISKDFDGSVLLGATDLYVKTIDNIKTLEFLEIDEIVNQGSTIIKLISSDESINNLYSAISGRIIQKNEKLLNDITLLEKDPYFNGWFYRIIPTQLDEEIQNLIPCSSDRN